MMLTPEQCRAARALLDWSQQKLADTSKIAVVTVHAFEAGQSTPDQAITALMQVLQAGGISFIDDNATSAAGGPGVRLLKSPNPEIVSPETVQYPEHMAPDAPTGAGG
ncbi:helix-turn-helix transcriptional regulator [Agrobacterium tumefaciens]|uniref:helix-turn-helix domain-containing protein n=1 Tax=Agrobacterium tumefaciens TaxID=358 RepID=UPI00287E3BFA|nr:helix-turn-helix transcriptional regulator [Agrobacterium tumefaciens]MDS7596768.1 helix-turn-helix domain-containing protein [Agrobacterium tumefaciens]